MSTRFKAHLNLLKESGHHVHIVTVEEHLDPAVRSSVESVTTLQSTNFAWYPAKRFPELSAANFRAIWETAIRVKPTLFHVTMCPSLPLFFMCARALNIPVLVSVHTDAATLLEVRSRTYYVLTNHASFFF